MKALAGPAMMVAMVAAFFIHRSCSSETSPSIEFTNLEFRGADDEKTGSCYELSTVLVANNLFGNASRTWKSPRKDAWTLEIENIEQGFNGPKVVFQRLTFERSDEQVRLVDVEASEGIDTDIKNTIDRLLRAPNGRKSTPVERCKEPGADKYLPERESL